MRGDMGMTAGGVALVAGGVGYGVWSMRRREAGSARMSADRRRTLKIVIAVAAVLVGLKVVHSGTTTLTGPPGPSSGSLLGGWSWSGPAADPLPFSEPLRVRVPSVGIDAPLVHLWAGP